MIEPGTLVILRSDPVPEGLKWSTLWDAPGGTKSQGRLLREAVGLTLSVCSTSIRIEALLLLSSGDGYGWIDVAYLVEVFTGACHNLPTVS